MNKIMNRIKALAIAGMTLLLAQQASYALVLYDFNSGVGTTDYTGAKSCVSNVSLKLPTNTDYFTAEPVKDQTFQDGDTVTIKGYVGTGGKKFGCIIKSAGGQQTIVSSTAATGSSELCEVTGTLSLSKPVEKLEMHRNGTQTTIVYFNVSREGAESSASMVEIVPQVVTGASRVKVYTNGTVALSSPYTVVANDAVKVVYTADAGYSFPNGTSTWTTNFTANAAATSIAIAAGERPTLRNPDDCVTFSSKDAFTLKSYTEEKCFDAEMFYSTNKTDWTAWDGKEICAGQSGGVGDYHLYLYGTENTELTYQSYWFFGGSASEIECSGNIETLRGAKGSEPSAVPMKSLCYASLFADCAQLTTAPTLTATNLADGCYTAMFAGCTALTKAPELPATTLTERCYNGMFYGCTALKKAPELPATTLKKNCYDSMFSGCTALTDLPDLLATTLADRCYMGMFADCNSLVVNTTAPGKAWSIPAAAATSAAAATEWNATMFDGNSGDVADTGVEVGKTYYVKSAAVATVAVAMPEVAGATGALLAFDVNGGWAGVATNEVPSNATVRVVWTVTEDGKALSGEGATGVFVWQTELVAAKSIQTAPAPTVVEAGASEITIDFDTRATKAYYDAADILPIWYAQGAEVTVGGATLVKNAVNTNTVSWVPASTGVYDFNHAGALAAQITLTTPVEVTTNGLEVAGTAVEVTVDGAALPEDGIVPSNSVVTATWTAAPGVYFMDGTRAYTQTFTADKALNAVSAAATKPEEPKAPSLKLGIVAQRYPWDGKLDVQYWAQNTPNEGYDVVVDVTLPDGTRKEEKHAALNGKHTTTFDAKAAFGEVQIPAGVKVRAKLMPAQ